MPHLTAQWGPWLAVLLEASVCHPEHPVLFLPLWSPCFGNLVYNPAEISDVPRVSQFLIPERHPPLSFRCVEPAPENISVRGTGLGKQGVQEGEPPSPTCSSISPSVRLSVYPQGSRWFCNCEQVS